VSPVLSAQRLHLGCGNEILPGWINHDLVSLPGVDVVHDLENFPWPFETDQFSEVRMHHVLEHLSNPVRTIEELHRILEPGGMLQVRVPYWNSPDWATDPTHRVAFNEYSFDYFDPTTYQGRERPYYSTARFSIRSKTYWIKPAMMYLPVRKRGARAVLSALARHFGGVIWVVEWDLVALKDGAATQ
jgi:SAM-dependent methyltransferase